MKFKVGDKVLVTAGKDKGMKSVITQVLPKKNQVVVEGANQYVKHVQPMPMINRPGERIRQERPLPLANIAILNNQGEPDRIGYKIKKRGTKVEKVRIFKKTGQEIDKVKKDDSKAKSTQDSTKKSKKNKDVQAKNNKERAAAIDKKDSKKSKK